MTETYIKEFFLMGTEDGPKEMIRYTRAATSAWYWDSKEEGESNCTDLNRSLDKSICNEAGQLQFHRVSDFQIAETAPKQFSIFCEVSAS
jgi:hypothetical protein